MSLFFPLQGCPCIFERFALLFQGFGGFGGNKKSLFWGIFPYALPNKNKEYGTKIQPEVFLTEVFGNPLGWWTSAPSGHGCPRRDACFSRISTALTEVLGRDIRANDPRMSAGCPSPKLPLWADFPFLKERKDVNLLNPILRDWPRSDEFRLTVLSTISPAPPDEKACDMRRDVVVTIPLQPYCGLYCCNPASLLERGFRTSSPKWEKRWEILVSSSLRR